jgi:hypothetical protein
MGFPVRLCEHKHPNLGPKSLFGEMQAECQCKAACGNLLIAFFLGS